MTPPSQMMFYDIVAMICAFMTLANLARVRSRGLSAYFLGLAFLILGSTLMLYALKGMGPLVWVGGVSVGILLIADIVYRTSIGLPGRSGPRDGPR